MPKTWAENLEERALAPQLGEIVQIDPGDFSQSGPEYGQKPKMTNIEARVLLGNDPGDKHAIEPSALGTTFVLRFASFPTFLPADHDTLDDYGTALTHGILPGIPF